MRSATILVCLLATPDPPDTISAERLYCSQIRAPDVPAVRFGHSDGPTEPIVSRGDELELFVTIDVESFITAVRNLRKTSPSRRFDRMLAYPRA